MATGDPPHVFVSYSHADTKWLKVIDPHLAGLRNYAKVEVFDDRSSRGGDPWDANIRTALGKADIVVLLVTANFTGSKYIHEVELPIARRRRETDDCVIFPI